MLKPGILGIQAVPPQCTQRCLSGLIRLESLVAEATSAPQQTLIAEAVDLVVFVDQEPELKAGRKVREVALVTGYSDAGIKSNSCDRKRRTI